MSAPPATPPGSPFGQGLDPSTMTTRRLFGLVLTLLVATSASVFWYLDALEETGGHKGRAAESLGISPRTLRYKLARIRERGVRIPGEGHE